jgi:carbamate kinase
MRIVIALGGNALLRRSDLMTTEVQRRNMDKAIQLRRQRAPQAQASPEVKAKPVVQATAG